MARSNPLLEVWGDSLRWHLIALLERLPRCANCGEIATNERYGKPRCEMHGSKRRPRYPWSRDAVAAQKALRLWNEDEEVCGLILGAMVAGLVAISGDPNG